VLPDVFSTANIRNNVSKNNAIDINTFHKWKSIYTNANSITGKMDELRKRVQRGHYDIVAITKSWDREDIHDC